MDGRVDTASARARLIGLAASSLDVEVYGYVKTTAAHAALGHIRCSSAAVVTSAAFEAGKRPELAERAHCGASTARPVSRALPTLRNSP